MAWQQAWRGGVLLLSRSFAAGFPPAEAEVKALFAEEARRRRSFAGGGTARGGGSGARGAGRARSMFASRPFHIQDLEYADRAGDGRGPDAGFQQRYDLGEHYREDWWPETWLQDQTLESAFRRSAVWYYRELALRVGAEAMQTRLSRLGQRQRGHLQRARQLLARRQFADFPARAGGWRGWRAARCRSARKHVATLRRIMVLDQGEGWTLSGKTGLGELAGRGPVRSRFEAGSFGGAGGPDLRLRHLPARPRHEDLRPAPHRADPAGAGVAGRAAGSDG